jgi:hypothetical protein
VRKRVWVEPPLPVQNVIDVKDQMTFKVLLANWWNLAPRWGAIEVPTKE